MFSIFALFFVELIAFRWGNSKLAKMGIQHDAHGHAPVGAHAHSAHGPEPQDNDQGDNSSDLEKHGKKGDGTAVAVTNDSGVFSVLDHSALAQITGIFILEFGILLHSILIGLTLAVDENFKVLFVVLVFHRTSPPFIQNAKRILNLMSPFPEMFEGLGLGSRLAFLKLPPSHNYVAICAAILYGFTTPIGIAAGLGVRSSYNPASTTASIVSGVMDSLSAGVLIYTGLVEVRSL